MGLRDHRRCTDGRSIRTYRDWFAWHTPIMLVKAELRTSAPTRIETPLLGPLSTPDALAPNKPAAPLPQIASPPTRTSPGRQRPPQTRMTVILARAQEPRQHPPSHPRQSDGNPQSMSRWWLKNVPECNSGQSPCIKLCYRARAAICLRCLYGLGR